MQKKLITPDLEDDWKLIRPSNRGGQGRVKYLVRKVFGHLLVLERAGTNKHGAALWECLCQLCNTKKVFTRPALMSGRVKSCGCLKASGQHFKPKVEDPQPTEPKRARKTRWSRLHAEATRKD